MCKVSGPEDERTKKSPNQICNEGFLNILCVFSQKFQFLIKLKANKKPNYKIMRPLNIKMS